MQSKHNKQLVPFAKQLRKEMTKEERHLWYDFLRTHPVRFPDKRCWESILPTFIAQKPSWSLNWMVHNIMKTEMQSRMQCVQRSLRDMV